MGLHRRLKNKAVSDARSARAAAAAAAAAAAHHRMNSKDLGDSLDEFAARRAQFLRCSGMHTEEVLHKT